MLLARTEAKPRALPPTFDEPNLIGWSGDSTRIIFFEPKKTRVALYAMPVDGPAKILYEPEKSAFTSAALNGTGTHVGFPLESPEEARQSWSGLATDRCLRDPDRASDCRGSESLGVIRF
jgi:hypothetical protein